jgi:nucleotide sugar dehydrogenase
MYNKIAIIGCGYVGLSLIKTFKQAFNIIGYDISEIRLNELKKNYKYDNVLYTNNETDLAKCNIYIIAVPTNIKEDGTINLQHLLNFKQTLNKYIKKNDTIILESSIYVGGTKELFGEFTNKDIFVGFSPERVSPGDYENSKIIPKIISGINNQSLIKIYSIYTKVIDTVVTVSSTDTAELCKLYENCFRVINIAYVNEIADISKNYNINFTEVMNASATKPFGFMPFYPGFGIGGFCLPQNPYYLMHGINNPKSTLPILYNSINILNQRPIKKANYYMKYKRILIIGIGFKRNQSLTAFSPTLKIYEELTKQNKHVDIYEYLNITLSIKILKQYDCIILNELPKSIQQSLIDEYIINKYGKVYNFFIFLLYNI